MRNIITKFKHFLSYFNLIEIFTDERYSWQYNYDKYEETLECVLNDKTLTKEQFQLLYNAIYFDLEHFRKYKESGLDSDYISIKDAEILYNIHRYIHGKYNLHYPSGTQPEYAYECFKKELLKYSSLESLFKEYKTH